MDGESRFDSVGWGFFGIVFLLCIGPCLYYIYENTYESTTTEFRVATALFLAGIAAAIISWITNSILGLIAARRAAGADGGGAAGRRESDEE